MISRNRIYLCLAHMSDDGAEQKFIKEAFDTNWVVPLGPNVNGFEQELENFIGEGKKVVALSSGTAAIHLALVACGVGYGDEVLVQSFTFCASSHPITYLGATPVFVDSEKDTWNMDPILLEDAILDRISKTGKRPKAIIPVALYGMPYYINRIMEVANRYNIPVIEDAAEGFGSRFNGQMIGTFGEYGVLSFNGNKMITTSGGGALICPNEATAERIRWYATQAREPVPFYHHVAIGYNYRMSNICAGIGRGQMTVANSHILHHRHIQEIYEELFEGVDGISVHTVPKGDKLLFPNYWLCTICISPELYIKGQENVYNYDSVFSKGIDACFSNNDDSILKFCRPNNNVEALRRILDMSNVESRPLWKPMHKQPVYQDNPAYVNGTSESLFKTGLCLPSGPCVKDEDVRYIFNRILEIIN